MACLRGSDVCGTSGPANLARPRSQFVQTIWGTKVGQSNFFTLSLCFVKINVTDTLLAANMQFQGKGFCISMQMKILACSSPLSIFPIPHTPKRSKSSF